MNEQIGIIDTGFAARRRSSDLFQTHQQESSLWSKRSSAEHVADLFRSLENRAQVVPRLDLLSENRSRQLKEQQNLYTPLLIIGTGPHATAFATEYKAAQPDAPILFVDKSEKRGGQFRLFSQEYLLNSANSSKEQIGIPLAKNNPNDLSPKSIVQVDSYSQTKYPTSIELGDSIR